jgi:hypothetical protein
MHYACRSVLPAIVIAMIAAGTAMTEASAVAPISCRINWTRTGGVWIYTPDCSDPSPGSPPAPVAPAPGGPPPGAPPNP